MVFDSKRTFLQKILEKRRVVELGAGMMPYGYALAATCGAKNFVEEPFYADKQRASVKAIIEEQESSSTNSYKVEGRDMHDYLKDEADELICVVACGIEDCILPNTEYRKQVEGEIYRVLERDAFFLSSHSDIQPQGLRMMEMTFRRPSNLRVEDRLRLYGHKDAFDKYGDLFVPYGNLED